MWYCRGDIDCHFSRQPMGSLWRSMVHFKAEYWHSTSVGSCHGEHRVHVRGPHRARHVRGVFTQRAMHRVRLARYDRASVGCGVWCHPLHVGRSHGNGQRRSSQPRRSVCGFCIGRRLGSDLAGGGNHRWAGRNAQYTHAVCQHEGAIRECLCASLCAGRNGRVGGASTERTGTGKEGAGGAGGGNNARTTLTRTTAVGRRLVGIATTAIAIQDLSFYVGVQVVIPIAKNNKYPGTRFHIF